MKTNCTHGAENRDLFLGTPEAKRGGPSSLGSSSAAHRIQDSRRL
jgi:hypothetical protein